MSGQAPHRICAIGLGRHGLNTIQQLLSHPDQWRIVSVADASAAAYARFQSVYSDRSIPCFASPAEALEHEVIDLVYVATTAPSHLVVAKAAIAAGHSNCILIEKPISTSLPEADSLLELTAGTNWPGRIGINFNRRCSRLYGLVKEIAESGELGPLVHIDYRRQMKVSMKGSHYIDLANWYAQAAPAWVSARLDSLSTVDARGAFFFDPEGWIEIGYQNGIVFCLDGTGAQSSAPEGMTVRFERGEIYVDADESFARVLGPGGGKEIPSDKIGFGYNWVENTFAALVLENGSFSPCSLEESITGLEVLVAAHLSSRCQGERVPLPLVGDMRAEVIRVA